MRTLLTFRRATAVIVFGFSCASLFAAPASVGSGSISGRVYNPATKEYVRNAEVRVEGTNFAAYTDDAGYYQIANVPAGEATVSVNFTGHAKTTAAVSVAPGQTVTHDFEFQREEVLQLGEFVVSADREGTAKALMDQRAALNAKTVVDSDTFGNITQGNIGEFLKYMPGITIDYVESEARAARIGGLDPKYTAVSLDGVPMATSSSANFNANSRQFEFDTTTINNIRSVEINRTLNATMDANGAAGLIAMTMKNAFETKGRVSFVKVETTANSYDMTLRKTAGPDDGFHHKMFPGVTVYYSDVYLDGRLGVQFNANQNFLFTEQYQEQIGLDFSAATVAARGGPVVNAVLWRPGPKITAKASVSGNVDFKVLPNLVLSLRSLWTHLDDEYDNRIFQLAATTANIATTSTLTSVTALPTTAATAVGSATRLTTGESHQSKNNDSFHFTPKLDYKLGALSLTGTGGYSRSYTHFEDMDDGYFASSNQALTTIGWTVTRSDAASPTWNVTQNSGPSWSNFSNFNHQVANPNNIGSSQRSAVTQIFLGKLDSSLDETLFGLPVKFQSGLQSRVQTFSFVSPLSQAWTYVGPSGNQLDPSTTLIPEVNYAWDPHKGGNVAQQGWVFPNRTAMYNLYVVHPEYFAPDAVNNFKNRLLAPRTGKEQIDAGYFMLGGRWDKLRFQLGVRNERTRVMGLQFDPMPASAIRAAGFPVSGSDATTAPGLLFEYQKPRKATYGRYDNWFTSAGAKYAVTPKLTALVGFSQAILRPDISNIAGTLSINDTTQIVQLPNPNLKPENSNKTYAELEYRLEPGGTLRVASWFSYTKNQVSNTRTSLTAAQAGFGDDPALANYTFQQVINAGSLQRKEGSEIEYRQNLTFLPEWARGVSVFGTMAHVWTPAPIISVIPKQASGGVAFARNKLNLNLRAVWNATRVNGTNGPVNRYLKEKTITDLSATYRLTRKVTLYLYGRNIFNQPMTTLYDREPGILREHDQYGAVWSFATQYDF